MSKTHPVGVRTAINNAKIAVDFRAWKKAEAALRPICFSGLGRMRSFVLRLEYIKASIKAGTERSFLSDVIGTYGEKKRCVEFSV